MKMRPESPHAVARCNEHRFAGADELARALGARIAENLRDGVTARGHALLAVSGGTTPGKFFAELAQQPLAWACVTITLTDERWVAPANPRSNESLVRDVLLRGPAAAAKFVPLYTNSGDPESGLSEVSARVGELALPFDAVVLGLGTDGHCASLFPDGDNFTQAVDPDGSALVLPMHSPSVPEPRITLTLPAIVATRALYLHIEGADKQRALKQVLEATGALARSPLRPIMQSTQVPLDVYTCA